MNVVLSIAGSDSSAGAGIQADIKSALYHNVYMSTAITAITAQNTLGVQGIQALDSNIITSQINSVLDDLDVKLIKIGMLGTSSIINTVKESLENRNIPIVLDPVAISRTGYKLIDDEAIEALKTMFSKALLITPNSFEAKEFFQVESIEDILACENYGTNILFKNIEKSDDFCIDILKTKENKLYYFQNPKVNTKNTHGTGCSYSSAIASLLANGKDLNEAIKEAKDYIYEALNTNYDLGKGNGPINHLLKT